MGNLEKFLPEADYRLLPNLSHGWLAVFVSRLFPVDLCPEMGYLVGMVSTCLDTVIHSRLYSRTIVGISVIYPDDSATPEEGRSPIVSNGPHNSRQFHSACRSSWLPRHCQFPL